jgi:predicted aldo/keto reductase-like oxidoreductase
MTRFIGVTSHHDPSITRQCIENFDFDTVLVPVNPAEPIYKNFIDEILPLANERQMGVIAMKVYLRGLAARIPGFSDMEPFFRFALSYPISAAVIGCDDLRQLEENIEFARSFRPMPEKEMQELEDFVAPYARELMYYKP